VTAVGPDVLILRPSIINLDVTSPDTMEGGATYATSTGHATLTLELFDSVSSELLARVIDTQAGGETSPIGGSNKGVNQEDANRIMTKWAKLLATSLQNARATAKTAAPPAKAASPARVRAPPSNGAQPGRTAPLRVSAMALAISPETSARLLGTIIVLFFCASWAKASTACCATFSCTACSPPG
jgi:hypothetical protein